MSKLVEKYYRAWLRTPKLFHPLDTEWFYRFVKACLTYKREYVRGGWLRKKLEKDLIEKIPDAEYREQIIIKAVSLFEHLVDFHHTTFPDVVLEMRHPYKVYLALKRRGNQDGAPLYTDKQIDELLAENFGADWEKKYQRRNEQ